MAFQLDFETEDIEGLTLTTSNKNGEIFLKNYECFGWYLFAKKIHPVYNENGERYSDCDLYDFVFYRDKNHPNINELKSLENKFQNLIGNINMKKDSILPGPKEKLNPDFFDFGGGKPLMEVYKLTIGKAIANTLLSFILIGLFMWLDSIKRLLNNKKARKYTAIQEECVKILNEAKDLV